MNAKRFFGPLFASMLVVPIVAACGGGGTSITGVYQPAPRTTTAAPVAAAATTGANGPAPASATAATSSPEASASAEASATPASATVAATAPATQAPATQPPAAATPTPTAPPAPAPAQITLAMRDESFSTTTLSVKANQAVTLVQQNEGKEVHNWALCQTADCSGFIAEGDLLTAGKQAQVQFTLDQPGTYKFECEVHTKTMVGTLVVS